MENQPEKSNQQDEVTKETIETKGDTKKGFNIKALLATGALALALPAGIAMHDKYQDENRFPDNYKPARQEQPYVTASTSPTAESAPEAVSIDYKDLSPDEQKRLDDHWDRFEDRQEQLDKHWENFEEKHANDPEPTPDNVENQ